MLIGVPPLLSPDALHALRSMGHGDEIALVDGNYPALEHGRRLVRADGLGMVQVLSAILTVMPLDRSVPQAIFRTGLNNDPALLDRVHRDIDAACARLAPDFAVVPVAGADFYVRVQRAFCVVATGERNLFANVILRKGVILPDTGTQGG